MFYKYMNHFRSQELAQLLTTKQLTYLGLKIGTNIYGKYCFTIQNGMSRTLFWQPHFWNILFSDEELKTQSISKHNIDTCANMLCDELQKLCDTTDAQVVENIIWNLFTLEKSYSDKVSISLFWKDVLRKVLLFHNVQKFIPSEARQRHNEAGQTLI